MDTVRLGIIGIGNMGSAHCEMIAGGQIKGMVLAAAADIRESRRLWVRERFNGSIKIFDTAEELINSDCCDAVLIATPHYDHPDLVIEALRSGKHVMCEKPAGVYTKKVREMNDEAKKAEETGLVFGIMYNQRTNHLYKKMHELIQDSGDDGNMITREGKYGAIKRVSWIITDWYRTQAYYNSGGWRATWDGEGGGVLLNQCPHNLDLIQWICGMPNKVHAHCHNGKWHDIEVEDDVTAYLEYPNGATGIFVTTTGDSPGTNRFEVTLDKAKIVCENGKLSVYELEMSEREYCYTAIEGFKQPEGKWIQLETDGSNPQHAGVMQAFTDRILNKAPLIADGRDGINGLILSNAMHLSSWLDKAVDIPFDEDLFLSELNKRRSVSRSKQNVTETTFSTDKSYGA